MNVHVQVQTASNDLSPKSTTSCTNYKGMKTWMERNHTQKARLEIIEFQNMNDETWMEHNHTPKARLETIQLPPIAAPNMFV